MSEMILQRGETSQSPTLAPDARRQEADARGSLRLVYRASLVASLLGTLIAYLVSGPPGLIGFAAGAVTALISLRGTEWLVRLSVRPGLPMARAWFSLLLLLKLPVLILLMTMAVWLVVNQVASPFALLAGVATVHTVILASAARSWLLTVLPLSAEPGGTETAHGSEPAPAGAGARRGGGWVCGCPEPSDVRTGLSGACEPFYLRCPAPVSRREDHGDLCARNG